MSSSINNLKYCRGDNNSSGGSGNLPCQSVSGSFHCSEIQFGSVIIVLLPLATS